METDSLHCKMVELQNKLENLCGENTDLKQVVESLLRVHVSRLERFVDSACSLIDQAQDISRDRLISMLCLVIIAQQENH